MLINKFPISHVLNALCLISGQCHHSLHQKHLLVSYIDPIPREPARRLESIVSKALTLWSLLTLKLALGSWCNRVECVQISSNAVYIVPHAVAHCKIKALLLQLVLLALGCKQSHWTSNILDLLLGTRVTLLTTDAQGPVAATNSGEPWLMTKDANTRKIRWVIKT